MRTNHIPVSVLVQRSQARDEHAFQELHGRFDKRVRQWVSKNISDPEDISDTSQEIWVAVWRFLPNFQGHSVFSTWLYRVVKNVAVSVSRKIKRRERYAGLTLVPDIADPRRDVEATVSTRLLLQRAHTRLLRMKASYRLLLRMCAQDYSYVEMGQVLGIPRGTVKATLWRARRAMCREMLKLRAA